MNDLLNQSNASASMQDNAQTISMEQMPSLPLLLGKAAFKSGTYRLGDVLPKLEVRVGQLQLDSDHVQRYRDVCGFTSNRIPATYLFVIAFPLFIRIMLDKNFPLRAMGQVHLRNKITMHRPIPIDCPLSVCASVGSADLTSRGLEWNIDTTVEANGQLVWSSQSTFLHRCNTPIKPQPIVKTSPSGNSQQWSFSADMGRRYAWISGDFNPIHLTNISAKVLGFKRAIAHGMYSKARCLAALDSMIPDAGYSVDVSFGKPLFLPSTVQFFSQQSNSSHQFSVTNSTGSQMHLEGAITQE
jgi:acyl dehydratase